MTKPPRLSSRAPWQSEENRLSIARRRLLERGVELLDLTESNPTRVSLDYPDDELAEILGEATRLSYDPAPLGLPSAREAVAAFLSTPDDPVDPSAVALTASTSEAYSFLFKLFCDPGDSVLTHSPTYPLLDHLASLEALSLDHFALDYEPRAPRRWSIDPGRAREALTDRTRLIVTIHPNNPTGHFLSPTEQSLVAECVPRDGALVSDEVFADYVLDTSNARAGSAAAREDVLAFSLGGLSKSVGLPHWKLGWIRVGGPRGARERVLRALELVADTYLSVNTPVQVALPRILDLAGSIQATIKARLQRNLDALRLALSPHSSLELLPVQGGWSAVIRLPRLEDDETRALALLERERIAVQPGYFFDFPADGFLVVSLLTEASVFDEATRRLVTNVTAR